MNIKDAYVHVGPSGTNEKALLKDFTITAALITLTRAILNDAGTGDKTETITIPTWNQSTTGNAATATKLAQSITLSLTGSVTGSASFDGSGNFSIATTTNHTHDYLHSVQASGALTTVSWAIETAKTVRRGFIYNTSGTEWSYLFGLSSSNTTIGEVTNNATYGAILKMGYSDRYLRILRVHSGKWYKPDNTQAALGSTEGVDWEKIHAGYADSAGSVAWTNVTGKPSLYNQSESDARFVLKAGDTMTGALTVPSLSVTGAATFSQAINGSILGNASTASRLLNARTITLSGNVTGSASFDGSGNISISTTVSGGTASNADTVDNEHASAFAHREAANNLVYAGNEITMVGSGYSGELYYNYRTTGGTNGNITKYSFCNGAGTVLGSISNGQFSGNAASATKLAASKTIWGQSFDGSANISGSMSGVTSINDTIYNIIAASPAGAGLKISEINQTLNGIDLSVVNFNGGSDSARPLLLQSNGSTGKVGIGLTIPSYKLDVSGEIHSSTYILAGSYMLAGTYVTAGSYVNAATYVRASGNDLYIGSASGSQCHQQYDSTNKVLKFIFD